LFNNSYYYYNLHLQGTKIYKHRIFTTVEYLFSGTRVIKNYPGSKLPGYPTAALVVNVHKSYIRVRLVHGNYFRVTTALCHINGRCVVSSSF